MGSLPQNTAQDQAAAVSTFADELLSHATQHNSCDSFTIPESVLDTLGRHLDQLPLHSGNLPLSTRRQLDSRGVELWNACTQLIATSSENEKLCVLGKVRAFAFALLDCAASNHGPASSRALGVALRAARTCLENNHLDLGLKILKIAAVRLDILEKSGADTSTPLHVRSASTEYYMLRIHLAWLQGRPDIADHLFSKVPQASSEEDANNVSEMCYRVGMLAFSNGDYTTAGRWLRRALDASDVLRVRTDPASRDMRLLALHALVRANAHIDTTNGKGQLAMALHALKAEYGNEFSVLMLRLEILSSEDRSSCQEYIEVLRSAVEVIAVTEHNMKLVLYHIQKLRCSSLELAVEVFRELLLNHLARSDKTAWVEQCVVILVWMLTISDMPTQRSLDIITEAAKRLTELSHGPLDEHATHASLVLIWRTISTAISNGNFHDAERWCILVLEQPMFRNCSKSNKAKLQMKSIASSLEVSNTSRACRTLDCMDEDSKTSPAMLCMIYKLALLEEDSQLGFESLSKLEAIKRSHLLDCAAEAQRLGKRRHAISIFQRVITGLDDYHEEIHIPALFQATICLLSDEFDGCKSNTQRTAILEETFRVFGAALNQADKQRIENVFSKADFEWLFQNSYKVALKSLKSGNPGPVVGLLDISTKIASLYQQHFTLEDQAGLHEHYLLCDFLKAIKTVSEARIHHDPVEKRTRYHSLRSTIQSFRARIPLHPFRNTSDWTERHRTMISLDFEAAIHLHQWATLPSLIEEARPIATGKLSAIFMDAILSSDAPMREVLRVVKLIICTNHKALPDQTTLLRYLRCLFQLALPSPTSFTPSRSQPQRGGSEADYNNKASIAEAVLDQILALERRSRSHQGSGSGYPADELEWLATTAFNRAVDFYRESEDGDCQRWAGKAIEVAELVDGGGLGQLLRRNLGMLGLG